MKMSKKPTIARSLLALSLGTAILLPASVVSAADHGAVKQRFTEFADVIDVQPVYQNMRVSEPRTECWTESQQHIVGYQRPHRESHQAHARERRHASTNAVVGGLIGGVIGNQLGRGHSRGSRTGATIAGAIIGGAVGNETHSSVQRHRQKPAVRHQRLPIYETVQVERCKEVAASRLEQRIQHYDVTYRYKGRSFTTRMKRDPGSQIELQISVAPARQ